MAEINSELSENWYEACMKSREDALFEHFGPTAPVDRVVKPQDEIWEMTIAGFAFLRYPPCEGRAFWLYVTHGLSQPCSAEEVRASTAEGLSGLGVEFAFATSLEEAWPFTLLEMLASYALLGTKPVLPLDRIPAGDLMIEAPGAHLLAMEKPGYDIEVQTHSIGFSLVHLVGATAAESAKAKEYEGALGSVILEAVLHECGIGGITDRNRECVTARTDFEEVWRACEARFLPNVPGKKKPFWKIW